MHWLVGLRVKTLTHWTNISRRKFQRSYYHVEMVDDCWEIDLLDVRALKTYNDGFTYVLAAIDVPSKFAWMETLKDKSGVSVATAF